jgi:hypothetical protein
MKHGSDILMSFEYAESLCFGEDAGTRQRKCYNAARKHEQSTKRYLHFFHPMCGIFSTGLSFADEIWSLAI